MSKYPGRYYGSITNQPNGGGGKKGGLASRATHYFIANATGSNYYTQTAHPKFNFHLKCSNQLGGVGNIKGHQTSAIADGQRGCGERCEFILDNEKSTLMEYDFIGFYSGIFRDGSGYTISGDNLENISLTGLLPISFNSETETCGIWNNAIIRQLVENNNFNTPPNLEVSGNPLCPLPALFGSMIATLVVEGSPGIIQNKLIHKGFSSTTNFLSSPYRVPTYANLGEDEEAIFLESKQDMEISFCGQRHGAREGPFILNGNSDISYIQDTSNVGYNPHIIAVIYNKITGRFNREQLVDPNKNYSYLNLFWYNNETNFHKIYSVFNKPDPFNNIYKFNLKLAQ